MTTKAQDAILKARQELDKKYVENGTLKITDLWNYVRYYEAIDIIETVINNADEDEDDEDSDILQKVVDKYGDLTMLVDEVEDNDYIIPDWNSNTDYHEYYDDVIRLAKSLLK